MSKNSSNGQATATARERASDRLHKFAPPVLGVLVIVNVLFFALALRPAGARARGERERMTKLEDDLKTRRAYVGRLRDIESKLDEARAEDAAFFQQKFLPRATGFSTIMAEVQKLGVETHVRRSGASYSLGDVSGHPDLYEVQIQTNVEGAYTSIVEFINRVERDPLFLLVDEISAAGGAPPPPTSGSPAGLAGQASQAAPVRLNIRLVTYFRE